MAKPLTVWSSKTVKKAGVFIILCHGFLFPKSPRTVAEAEVDSENGLFEIARRRSRLELERAWRRSWSSTYQSFNS